MPSLAANKPRLRTRQVNNLDDRVKAMQDMIKVGLRDPEMRKVALAVAAGDEWTLNKFVEDYGYRPLDNAPLTKCVMKDDLCELENIFRFVRGNVRYTGDISNVDTYTSARRTIFEMKAGDCDDSNIAIATLAIHNGFGVVSRTVAQSRDARGRPNIGHIYPVALVPKFKPIKGIALDVTLMTTALGVEPKHIARVDYRVF